MPVLASAPRKVASPEEILATPAEIGIDAGVNQTETPATVAPKAPKTEVDADLAEAQANRDRLEKKAPADASKATGFRPIRFVKNIHPLETIVFKDRTTFRFPNTLFVCDNPELAEKILAVAEQFNIVLQ